MSNPITESPNTVRDKIDHIQHNLNTLFNDTTQDPKILEKKIHSNYYRCSENIDSYNENKLNKMQFSPDEKKQYLNQNLIKIRQNHTEMIKNHKKSRSMMLANRTQNHSTQKMSFNHPEVKTHRLAGKDSESLTTEIDRAMKVASDDIREFNDMSEQDRRIHYSNMIIKDHNYYNKKDSLWNEPHRLHPKKFAIYSEKNLDPRTTFKQNITNLDAIHENQKKEEFQSAFNKICNLKEQDSQRRFQRTLEREILQFQSSQNLTDEKINQIKYLSEQDPDGYEEMLHKKKWKSVHKNPSTAIKDIPINNQYWNLINNLPKQTVDSIVTPRVLKMDKESCDNLLKNLLEEKVKEDQRKEILKQEKQINRNKLVHNHNLGLENQEKLGIKIAAPSQRSSQKSQMVQDGLSFGPIESQMTLDETNKFLGTRNITQPSQMSQMSAIDEPAIQVKCDNYQDKLDKYKVENDSKFLSTRMSLRTQYNTVKSYQTSERTKILSMPKSEYQGKDFFQRKEFRGLFLADHQEALGKKAFKCVDDLNHSTVNKFNSIASFRENISNKKTQQSFYKTNTQIKPFYSHSYKDSGAKASTANLVNRRGNDSPKHELDVQDYKNDNHHTLDKERSRMASTFQMPNGGENFLPQVVQHSSSGFMKQSHTQRNTEMMNKSPFQKEISKQIISEYNDHKADERFEDLNSKLLISQIPLGASKQDFKVNKARSLINNKKYISNCYTPDVKKQFHAGPTQSPDIRGNPSPNYMVGQGFENAGFISLQATKQESVRGIFTNSNRQNVLEHQINTHGLKPPPYNAYLSNGEIPTKESPLSQHIVSGCIPKSPTHKSPFINRNPLLNTQSGFGFPSDNTSKDSLNASMLESSKRRAEEAQRIVEGQKKIFT